MPITVKLEGIDYELPEVDLTYTLAELRDAVANDAGTFKIFDAAEWRLRFKDRDLDGDATLLQLDVPADASLEIVRVAASNRPPKADQRRVVKEVGPPPTELTCRFDAVIDVDDRPHALAYAGMTSRLRDAAAIRELARAPEPRHDALRAVYAAVDDMLARDEASRTVTAGALTIKVLIEDV